MTNQKSSGDIIIDSISTLIMTMKNGSILVGSIDSNNQAKKVSLSLSSDSILSLTSDTYLDSLENENSNNSNIYSNGKYKLYVDGQEISINSDNYDSSSSNVTRDTNTTNKNTESNSNNSIIYYIIGGIGGILLILCVTFLIKRKTKMA